MRRASAFLAAALVAAACTGDAEPDSPAIDPTGPDATATASASPTPDSTASATPSVSDSPTPASAGLRSFGPSTNLGRGFPITATPDGRQLLVLAPIPGDDRLGCEGVPFEGLWTVDVLTGERELTIDAPTDEQPFISEVMFSGNDGEAILIASCEGFLGSIDRVDFDDDGHITSRREVTLPPIELRPWTIHWMPGGEQLVATGAAEFENPGVFLIDTLTDDWQDLTEEPLDQWIPVGDDRVVEILDRTATLVDGDGGELTRFPADEVHPSNGGLPALAVTYDGESGDLAESSLLLPDATREILADEAVFSVTWSHDDRLVSWTTYDFERDLQTATIRDLETGREVVIDDIGFTGVTFLDAGIITITDGPEGPDGWPTFELLFRPWDD